MGENSHRVNCCMQSLAWHRQVHINALFMFSHDCGTAAGSSWSIVCDGLGPCKVRQDTASLLISSAVAVAQIVGAASHRALAKLRLSCRARLDIRTVEQLQP